MQTDVHAFPLCRRMSKSKVVLVKSISSAFVLGWDEQFTSTSDAASSGWWATEAVRVDGAVGLLDHSNGRDRICTSDSW